MGNATPEWLGNGRETIYASEVEPPSDWPPAAHIAGEGARNISLTRFRHAAGAMQKLFATFFAVIILAAPAALAQQKISSYITQVGNGNVVYLAEAETPRSIVHAYLQAMEEHNVSPSLPIYTRATQEMLRGWNVTPAQIANIVGTYRHCSIESEQVSGNYAVVRYPVDARQCAPFFLVRQGGKWRLDLTMLQKAIRFGRNNAWRLDLRVSHPYGFAFDDWQFDANGFPVGER